MLRNVVITLLLGVSIILAQASCDEHELAWLVCGHAEEEMVNAAQNALSGTCKVFLHQTKTLSVEDGLPDENIGVILLTVKCDDVKAIPPDVIWNTKRFPLVSEFGFWQYTRRITIQESLEGKLKDVVR